MRFLIPLTFIIFLNSCSWMGVPDCEVDVEIKCPAKHETPPKKQRRLAQVDAMAQRIIEDYKAAGILWDFDPVFPKNTPKTLQKGETCTPKTQPSTTWNVSLADF